MGLELGHFRFALNWGAQQLRYIQLDRLLIRGKNQIKKYFEKQTFSVSKAFFWRIKKQRRISINLEFVNSGDYNTLTIFKDWNHADRKYSQERNFSCMQLWHQVTFECLKINNVSTHKSHIPNSHTLFHLTQISWIPDTVQTAINFWISTGMLIYYVKVIQKINASSLVC